MTLNDKHVQNSCSAYLKSNQHKEIQFENSKLTHDCVKDSDQKINR
jgi:hypothetical protein